jgi:hypothetical protein
MKDLIINTGIAFIGIASYGLLKHPEEVHFLFNVGIGILSIMTVRFLVMVYRRNNGLGKH